MNMTDLQIRKAWLFTAAIMAATLVLHFGTIYYLPAKK